MSAGKINIPNVSRVVMVCTGNTCRSPMAWGIGLREAERRGLAIDISSAGTVTCDGCEATFESAVVCRENGIDISSHRSRQAGSELYSPDTLFAVMTASHAWWLMDTCSVPAENIVLLGDGIPDPFGCPVEIYEKTFAAIESAVCELFDQIEKLTGGEEAQADEALCSEYIIRRAQTGDMVTVAETEAECFADSWTESGFLQEVENELADFAVVVQNGTVCGYGLIITAGDVSELPKICVAPECRRRGMAEALLCWLEGQAHRRGSAELTLEVRESNSGARRLYEKFGFEFVGMRPRFYSQPTEDAVIMTKKLTREPEEETETPPQPTEKKPKPKGKAVVKELLSKTRAALDKYGMIPDGSRVAVGISGGKDSLATLYALAEIRRFYPNKFTLVAVTADPCFGGKDTDFSAVTQFCQELGVEHIIRRTRLYEIVFEEQQESNPCALCARMRRGILHNMALEAGCTHVALGHHADDAAETVLMNLFQGGRFAGLPAKSWLDRKQITVIRPLIFCDESLIERVAKSREFPVVVSNCPADGKTERKKTRELIEQLEVSFPDLRAKLTGAAERMSDGQDSADRRDK